MADDPNYQEYLEKARLLRSQGIRITASKPRPNRIEEMLRREEAPKPVKISMASRWAQLKSRLKKHPIQARNAAIGLSIALLLLGIGLGGYRLFRGMSAPPDMTTEQVVQAVSKLVAIPTGQMPTVATVTDLAPLAGQAFFKDAQVGDKVLIFSAAGKAILYRPSDDKIIAIAPITK